MVGADAPALSARGLTRSFGERVALRDVSFDVHDGELLAVIGPNGAGKTTLLSILAGSLAPSAGEVVRPPGRHSVGWVPQEPALYAKLSAAENLRLFAHLEGVEDLNLVVGEMLDQIGLAGRGRDQVRTLSGGNQQRVNIAIGLLSRPRVLLLDEPSSSLDPRQRERLWEFVGALAERGTGVVYSTHDVFEAERYAARVLVLGDGELVFTGTPAELERAAGQRAGGPGGAASDFEGAFVRFLRERGH